MPVVHYSVFQKAEKEFTEAFGQSLIQWGVIEQRLCFWFQRLTGMNEKMARQIFYTVTSFNARSRMLRGALSVSEIPDYTAGFLDCAIKKAVSYDTFRNQVVHREALYDFRESSKTVGRYILIEGKSALRFTAISDDDADVFTADDLLVARGNFRELARLSRTPFSAQLIRNSFKYATT